MMNFIQNSAKKTDSLLMSNEFNQLANWEEFFIQEALELEEKMKYLDSDSLAKSKLRLGLENGILDWANYEKWYQSNLLCCSLKSDIEETSLDKFVESAMTAQEAYSNYDFWSEDLIPFFIWDDQLIILGLQFNENLVQIKNHIFILTPPQILSLISSKIVSSKEKSQGTGEKEESSKSMSKSALDGIDLNIMAPKIDFNDPSIVSIFAGEKANSPVTATADNALWDFIGERHQEYSFEVKKQFDAFLVLKVSQNKTSIFKSDTNISPALFEFNLDQPGPFKKAYTSGAAEQFSLKQHNMNVSDFESAYVTPLKRGKEILGFFVGLKKSNCSAADQKLLDELAKETAS